MERKKILRIEEILDHSLYFLPDTIVTAHNRENLAWQDGLKFKEVMTHFCSSAYYLNEKLRLLFQVIH